MACTKNKAEDKEAAHMHESISVIMTTCFYEKDFTREKQ